MSVTVTVVEQTSTVEVEITLRRIFMPTVLNLPLRNLQDTMTSDYEDDDKVDTVSITSSSIVS
jgi:hypothetical protein